MNTEQKCTLFIGVFVSCATFALGARADCSGDSQKEMNECAVAAFNSADRQLNGVYEKLEPTPELKAAEQTWVAYREAQCRYEAAAAGGGSMQNMLSAGCMATVTKMRTAQLYTLSKEVLYAHQR